MPVQRLQQRQGTARFVRRDRLHRRGVHHIRRVKTAAGGDLELVGIRPHGCQPAEGRRANHRSPVRRQAQYRRCRRRGVQSEGAGSTPGTNSAKGVPCPYPPVLQSIRAERDGRGKGQHTLPQGLIQAGAGKGGQDGYLDLVMMSIGHTVPAEGGRGVIGQGTGRWGNLHRRHRDGGLWVDRAIRAPGAPVLGSIPGAHVPVIQRARANRQRSPAIAGDRLHRRSIDHIPAKAAAGGNLKLIGICPHRRQPAEGRDANRGGSIRRQAQYRCQGRGGVNRKGSCHAPCTGRRRDVVGPYPPVVQSVRQRAGRVGQVRASGILQDGGEGGNGRNLHLVRGTIGHTVPGQGGRVVIQHGAGRRSGLQRRHRDGRQYRHRARSDIEIAPVAGCITGMYIPLNWRG